MIKKLILYINIIFLLLVSLKGIAQDPSFSQFYANPLYLNPALAGSTFTPRLIINYRNQWPSLDANFVTYSASYDQFVDNISSSFGIMVNTDRAGDGVLNTSTFSGIYTYTLRINRHTYLNAGLQASFYQRKLDWEQLIFDDQINPVQGVVYPTSERPPDNLDVGFLDFSAGLLLGYKDIFYGGLAVHHLTEPYDGFYSDNNSRLNSKFTFHLGGVIDMESRGRRSRRDDALTLSPNIMYQQQETFKQVNIGLYLNRFPFVLGTWYRHNMENPDAFIVMVGFKQETFQFGYSYDITVSKLKNVTGGAHEISFQVRFKNPSSRRRRVQAIPCPSF